MPDGFWRARVKEGPAREDERVRALEAELAALRHDHERLAARTGELQRVADAMSAAVCSCATDLRLLWVNRVYAEWNGRGQTPAQMVGMRLPEVVGIEAFVEIGPHLREVLEGRRVQ